MASLKELKIRINSVKSTRKITKAMKMVAASKLKKARDMAEQATPYAQRMERMLNELASNIDISQAPPLMKGTGEDKKHLIIAVSADRGLCGGFNTNIVKAVKKEAAKLSSEGKTYKIICLGKKAYEVLKPSYEKHIEYKVFGITKQKKIPFQDAENEIFNVIKMFDNGEFDVCTVFYNRFVSAIAQEVTRQQLIPLEVKKSDNDNIDESAPIYGFEPDESEILKDLLPRNLSVQLYYALLESSASEQASRMTAMDNATRNAGSMLDGLTLQYNRTRQAQITKELIEIISGADAV